MVVVVATSALLAPVPAAAEDAAAAALAQTHFRVIAAALRKAKKVVAVAGAGISVAAGIPDFRSADGLYNLVKNRYPHAVVKGKDMFDAGLFRDPLTTSIFYTFISELKLLSDAAQLTQTHTFLKTLNERGQLLRCYTQNIDCLESRLNLAPKVATPSSRSAGASSSSAPSTPQKRAPPKPLPTLVHLHGALDTLICTLCKTTVPFQSTLIETCKNGTAPACSACLTSSAIRSAQGKRALACGVLRPNIVLYGEHHSAGADISKFVGVDIKKRPDVVLVMGTSLKVEGVRTLVKNMAKACHGPASSPSTSGETVNNSNGGGIVVLLNRTRLGKEWDSVFDYQVLGDVDDCVNLLESEMARLAALARPAGRKRTDPAGSSDGLVQTKLTDMMKVVKADPSVASVVSTAEAAVLAKKDVDAPAPDSEGDQENGDHEDLQASSSRPSRAVANNPSKKPLATKVAVKKPLKLAQPSTVNKAPSTAAMNGSGSIIRPKTVSATTGMSSKTALPVASIFSSMSKPSTTPIKKKSSKDSLKCTPQKPTPKSQAFDTPSKYMQVLTIGDDSSKDEEEGHVLHSPVKDMIISSEHVRSSSVVRKEGEGSPTKKVKRRSLDNVLVV
ncbi:DHS-like NAD/FAD-binding domain-containing protein [Obelidium mucronatum]|nr:DHS-like NAD/FAD-binding domain-containing protein [Obelidium mucronatum]